MPDIEDRIAIGNLDALPGWLRQKVHRYGRQYDASELIKNAAGRALGEECFIE